MKRFGLFLFLFFQSTAVFPVHAGDNDFPVVSSDFQVSLFAKDPLVRNPCAITFDDLGRLFVGMGPQYRSPTPDIPPDSVWIVTDEDGDGTADQRQQFATGFNSIQGLTWKGEWLWVANAPDLTRVRDTDGDDIADEYIRVYTDLGNLEHGLHGLTFGPDGKLYMSKGNSKGLSQPPNRIAPAPFRELWGVSIPPGIAEPEPVNFTAKTYQKNYHDPRDDWGMTGGILRCNDDGSNLEIISRGFRNPWDIAFDQSFDWLGTDNDQTKGDKIFTPFFGAHFGWGHSWSYDWKGDNHLPTVPSSGPLFEGSGTGVAHCNVKGYPKKYQNLFLINDWLNRETLIYRSRWDGAWRMPDRGRLEVLAHAGGGRTMPLSSGRSFDPVDIEVGPDGAIWISSWGRQYGAYRKNGQLANEGRIYRLWPKSFSPKVQPKNIDTPEQLISALGHHHAALRTNAQEKLIKLGRSIEPALKKALQTTASTGHETWLIWTLGRINPGLWFDKNDNQKIQSLRLAAHHRKDRSEIISSLSDQSARVRLAAVSTLRQLGNSEAISPLLELAAREDDRIVFYATWSALMDLAPLELRTKLLSDSRPPVRLAAILGLLEQDALSDQKLKSLTTDSHPPIAGLAKKRLGGKHLFEQRGRPLAVSGGLGNSTPVVIPFDRIRASSGNSYLPAKLTSGTRLYTDRDYRIKSVPGELEGLTFLQTSCDDADATSGITVTINLKYPSTVYFIDDARAENLPKWAGNRWKKTSLEIEGDDPRKMSVYSAKFPAGQLALGTSRDGIRARKGNYLIAVRPVFLAPDGSTSTEESVLPLLKNANPDHGKDLFFSSEGANCAACHQVGTYGNNHAPDLTSIGSRADARSLIDSILNPSSNIVEGFSAHAIKTKNRESFTGVILQETGQQLVMALADGSKKSINSNEIVHRESLPMSAMPSGYAALLTDRQIANLVSWLLSLKKPAPINNKKETFRFQQKDHELELFLGKQRIATYLLDHEKLTRRAFVNLTTPSGIPVTRNFPARKPDDIDPGYRGENGIIHPHMHPGLWMSFGWISGNDYWRLRSKVVHEEFLEKPSARLGHAGFKTRDRYLSQDGKETICIQETRYQFQQVHEGILMNWDTEFYNNDRDIIFGDQEESGLAFRIASPLRVRGGQGHIVNDRGEKDGSGTWGKPFQWINYSGNMGDKRVGLLVIPHTDNPRQSWSHSRDYGVLVANPFPKQPSERREPYITTTIKKGERLRLRYRILIHEVPTQSFDPVRLADRIRAIEK